MTNLRRVLSFVLIAALLLVVFAGGWFAGRLGIGSVVKPASMTDLEREFAERMRNVRMVGSFTVAGREEDQGRTPRADGYEIASVEKIGDDLWRFNATMNCCGAAGKGLIPIAVPMKWVGDTPVIMMTDASLPGLGTFTVRVFFYGDRYAGTWQHGEVGGHMSGRIEKQQTP